MLQPLFSNLSPLGSRTKFASPLTYASYVQNTIQPWLWYKFNEGYAAGTSGNTANHGSLSSAYDAVFSGNASVTYWLDNGLIDGSYFHFNSGAVFVVPDVGAASPYNKWEITVIVNPHSLLSGSDRRIVGGSSGAILRWSNGVIQGLIRGSGGFSFITTTYSFPDLTKYYVISFKYDDTSPTRTGSIFVNGTECGYSAQQSTSGTYLSWSTGMSIMSNNTATVPFQGHIDEMLFSSPLTNAQRTQLVSLIPGL